MGRPNSWRQNQSFEGQWPIWGHKNINGVREMYECDVSCDLVVHLTFNILFDKFFCSQIARRPKWIPSSSRAWCATSVWLNKVLWCEQWTRDHTARRYRRSRVLGAEQRNLRGRQGQCSPAVITNELNWWPQLPPSIRPYNHHNHLHSLTAFPCTPPISPFRILSHTT